MITDEDYISAEEAATAKEIKFYLNLGKKSKYSIEVWIKYINNITNFKYLF